MYISFSCVGDFLTISVFFKKISKFYGIRIVFVFNTNVKISNQAPAILCFSSRKKAAEAARDICMVYEEGVIGKSITRKWFAKFKNGNFDINNMPCSGRPSEFDEDHLKALLKKESCQTSRELAKKNQLQSKNDSQSSSFNGIFQKIGSLGAS